MENATATVNIVATETEEQPVKVIKNYAILRSLIKDYAMGKDLIDLKPSRDREGALVGVFIDSIQLRNNWQEIVYKRKKARAERQKLKAEEEEEIKEPLEQED